MGTAMGERSMCKILLPVLVLLGGCHGQGCDPNGVSCINCTDYRECSGGAPSGPIFSCKNGAKCGDQPLLKHCRSKLNCYALDECTEVGIFPDATVESNYFVCLPDSGSGFLKFDFTCPEGEFFDKSTLRCIASAVTSETTVSSTLETTTLAPTPEITTTTPASTPEVTTTTPASTPEITTTTPASTPEVTTTTPASTPEVTTTTPASTPEVTTTTPASTPEITTITSTPTPTTTPSPFACTSSGIFPNPTNCKMYFRCSTSLKVFYYICPGASYFNENILKCSMIITPACQDQILQNTTTSTTPVTTTSTVTTPAPKPPLTTTTTTPAPTTTTKIPPPTQSSTTTTTASTTPPSTTVTPFSCSAAGTYENPLDCKSYYRCSSSGKTFLYVCPNGSYYNEFTKRCGLTITPRCRTKLAY